MINRYYCLINKENKYSVEICSLPQLPRWAEPYLECEKIVSYKLQWIFGRLEYAEYWRDFYNLI